MNLSTLIKNYFASKGNDVTIDVFDEKNIYDVYQRVVGVLTQYIEIDPAEVVANRINVAGQYNETFLTDNELEELW